MALDTSGDFLAADALDMVFSLYTIVDGNTMTATTLLLTCTLGGAYAISVTTGMIIGLIIFLIMFYFVEARKK